MSSASAGREAAAPRLAERAAPSVQAAVVLGIAAGFVLLALAASRQLERLIWRPVELLRMFEAAGSLAADFPGRFVALVFGSVLLMIAAEYRPQAVFAGSTAIWLGLGGIGTGAYLLSTFDLGTRWALGILLAGGGALTAAALARGLQAGRRRASSANGRPGSPKTRPLLPLVVGLVGGLIAARGSIEPVTEWDAIIYHVSFARDWMHVLPGLPHAAGPSVGAELSYNYPALFPSIAVAIAAPVHLSAVAMARLISPLAALTILAVLRCAARRPGFGGWAPSMFLLGSAFFVAYAEWPTAYMLMLVLTVLAVASLVADRRLNVPTAALIGLIAGTALIGFLLAAIILGAYLAVRLGTCGLDLLRVTTRALLPRIGRLSLLCALLAGPIAVVALASLHETRSLFFPWVTWPHRRHLLPATYWDATQREIVANSYGQFDAQVGDFVAAARGIASSKLLAPGGLVLPGLILVACAAVAVRLRRTVLTGTALVAAGSLLLVALQLVWLRYFVALSIAAAVGLGVVVGTLRANGRSGRRTRIDLLAFAAAAAAALASLASGAAYGVAGPNDRGYTATMNYAQERASAFETAGQAGNARKRGEIVFGDDTRAWRDIETLNTAGVTVATFDDRNYFSPYRPRLQLDGLAAASITGRTGAAVARQLQRRGIAAVFMPSWFWEPGPGRDPLADRSPVALWIGSPSLPALRVYLPDPNVTYPSVLYAVGARGKRRAGPLLGQPGFSIVGPLSSRQSVHENGIAFEGIVGRGLHWRVAGPVTEAGGPGVRFTTNDVNAALAVTVNEPRVPTLFEPATFVDCTRVPAWARRSTLDVLFPGSPLGFAILDISGSPTTWERFHGEAGPIEGDVLVHACGDPTSARGGVFPAGNTAARIILDSRDTRLRAISFDFLDSGARSFSFNAFDSLRGRWVYDVAGVDRCGSGRWLHAQLPITQLPGGTGAVTSVELGPVVTGTDLTVRNLRLVEGHERKVPHC